MEVREPSAKYLASAAFKQSEVGAIPADWSVVPLGALTHLMTNGFVGVATSHYTDSDSGVLYIQGYNVEENSFNLHGIKRVTGEFHRNHLKSCLREGDLLTVQTGDVGLTTIIPRDLVGANCHALIISRFDQKKVVPKYIAYCLNSTPGRSRLKLIETGTTMKHLNVGDMLHFTVPVPSSVEEQQAIATTLSDADALIESLEQLLAKKRQIKQGAMQELLTAKRRLPGFEGEWETYLLGELVSRLANGSMYQVANRDGVSVTRIETIATGEVDLNRVGQAVLSPALIDYKVRKHDILFSHINSLDHIGKVALFNGESDLYHGINLLLIRPGEKANGVFLYYWLSSNRARRLMRNMAKQAVSQASINTTELRGVALKIPGITEQTAIAAVLSDMDADITTLEAKLAKARAIKQGMMQELLTGRIRLVSNSTSSTGNA